MRKRRIKYLKGKSCRVCGSKRKLVIATKNYKIKYDKNIWSYSQKKQQIFLKNKETLCYKHWIILLKKRRYPITHGTRRGYRTYNCKCKKCMAWSAARGRERRRQKKEKLITKIMDIAKSKKYTFILKGEASEKVL